MVLTMVPWVYTSPNVNTGKPFNNNNGLILSNTSPCVIYLAHYESFTLATLRRASNWMIIICPNLSSIITQIILNKI